MWARRYANLQSMRSQTIVELTWIDCGNHGDYGYLLDKCIKPLQTNDSIHTKLKNTHRKLRNINTT